MIFNILYIICFLVLCVLLHLNMHKYLHILQQSFYHTTDMLNNIKSSKLVKLKGYDIVLFIIAISSIFVKSVTISYILILVYIIILVFAIINTIKNKKVEKKKFVITNRIKIIYSFCYSILLVVCILLYYTNIKYALCIFSIYSISSLIIVAFSNVLSLPLIHLLNYRYIKEARNIIKEHKELKVIGITGSYGKTSTKNIIYSVLKEKYNTVMTPKSYNTTLGVTKTIREEIKSYTEVFVCEMGASRLGDIRKICKIVKPDISVITSIGMQHLSTFYNIENIIKEKFNIVKMSKKKAAFVLNMDNDYIRNNYVSYVDGREVIKYSLREYEKNYVKNIVMNENGSKFDVVINNETINIETKLLGIHNIYNILCAIIIAKKLGMEKDEIRRAVKKINPIEHRLELKHINNILILDDSFNSNPEGSSSAIKCLNMFKDRYKVLVTPGMVELGKEEKILNKKLGNIATSCDFVILEKSNVSEYVKEGMEEKNYENYVVVDSINKVFELLSKIKIEHENLIALIENDLPDCYL